MREEVVVTEDDPRREDDDPELLLLVLLSLAAEVFLSDVPPSSPPAWAASVLDSWETISKDVLKARMRALGRGLFRGEVIKGGCIG
jgi:hypothetical protein